VRIRIVDAVEDGVMREQQVVAVEIDVGREDEEQRRNRNGDPAPRRRPIGGPALVQRAHPAGDQQKEDGNQADGHRHRQHPVQNEVPRRQSEQEEAEGLAEDRVSRACGRRVPPQGQRRPIVHHGAARDQCPTDADDPAGNAQHGFNREFDRLSAEDDGVVPWQVALVSALQCGKRAEQNDEGGDCERREDSPLQVQGLPEDVPVAKRPEPQQVHPVRQGAATAEQGCGQDGEDNQQTDPVPWISRLPGIVNRYWQFLHPAQTTH
jgi:hypothetical protein